MKNVICQGLTTPISGSVWAPNCSTIAIAAPPMIKARPPPRKEPLEYTPSAIPNFDLGKESVIIE